MTNKLRPCCFGELREYVMVRVKLNALMGNLHWRERTIFCTYELTHSRSGNGQSDNSHIKENKAIVNLRDNMMIFSPIVLESEFVWCASWKEEKRIHCANLYLVLNIQEVGIESMIFFSVRLIFYIIEWVERCHYANNIWIHGIF